MIELVKHVPTLDMNVTDNIGRTPLHLAAAQGFVKRVEEFVKHKPDITAKYDMYAFGEDVIFFGNDNVIRNITPLVLAASHNHFEVVRSLLNAARSQNIQLINADCRILKKLRFGEHPFPAFLVRWSPFQLVAFKGHVQTLEVLLKVSQIIQPRLLNIITSLGHPINT
jgi:ankyrin repeat protein